MLAEGMTTSEVARRLNHSERTIKSVPHHVITRLGLRNRTQAVAYAIRSGVVSPGGPLTGAHRLLQRWGPGAVPVIFSPVPQEGR